MNINQLNLSNATEIKAYLEHQDLRLNKHFFDMSIKNLQNKRARVIDKLLVQLWALYQLDDEAHISINAVGGYGRSTLHPRSDIDLCVIYEEQLSSKQEQKLSQFLTRLWDLGLDIGQAVRSFQDNLQAASQDITIATNLLDIRTLSGPKNHADDTLEAMYNNSVWTSRNFFKQKLEEQENRHQKSENTPLYLEPNIKENPGGIRDVQSIVWVARKHLNANDIKSLLSQGFLKSDEYFELLESYDFICRIRWALHSVANRPQERLLFEYQFSVAEFMQFGHGDNAQFAVEKMMRQLFRAMTRIQEINQMICDLLKREVLKDEQSTEKFEIDEHFTIYGSMIQANYDEVFFNKRHVLRLFKLIAQYPKIKSIAPDTPRYLDKSRWLLFVVRNLLKFKGKIFKFS